MRKRSAGFTILEVIIALMIFAMASGALVTAMWRALHMTQLTREEIVLSFIEKDLAARNQLKASISGPNPAFSDEFSHLDGISLISEDQAWGIYIQEKYDGMVGSGTLVPSWEQNLLYRGYDFLVEDITINNEQNIIAARNIENNQFVDFDGYGVIDERETGVDIGDATGAGPSKLNNQLDSAVPLDPNGLADPTPSHGVTYDSTKMKHYMKLLRLTVGWESRLSRDVSDINLMRTYLTSGKHAVMYFTIYNPDIGSPAERGGP